MRGYIRTFTTERLFLIAASFAVVVFVIAESLTASHIAHAQIRVSPFTIRQENRMFTADHVGGELVDVKTTARRSDGAHVEISHVFGKIGFFSGENSRRIVLPTGERITAYDTLRGVTRWNTTSAAQRNQQKTFLFSAPTGTGCVRPGEQSVGKETIMGQETVAVLWPQSGNNKVTEWRALNLNCEPIQAKIEEKQPDGTYKLHNEISPVSLVAAEPDPALFDVPQDYTELKPSEVMHKEADKLRIGWNSELEESAQRGDKEYSKSH